ncbi:MAG: cytochrome c biogenesis protein ResB [Deltaproteobacteria bacterium]|nr:cytochrome c biogenesis protein ResB [Deltaproteobacteria bacterium]
MTVKQNGFQAFFTSLKLAMVLLGLIALGSTLGTLIPQGEAAEPFAAKLPPALLAVFQALQLFNVFHSAWFILLLLLLAVNLIVCSLDRFPAAWRQVCGGVTPERPDLFAEPSEERTAKLPQPPETAAEALAALLKERCGKVYRGEQQGKIYLAGQRGAFSRLGVYAVHLGVLLMLAGGIVGAVFGVKGYVEIAEGETSSTLQLPGGKPARQLDFAIRCDRFTVEFYETGAPKLFRSDLTFLKNGQSQLQGALLVNHPLAYGGLRFYQASYGVLPGGKLKLGWVKEGKPGEGREVAPGDRFPLPGAAAEVSVLRVEGDLMHMGPAAKLSVVASGKEVQFWVFANIDQIKAANPGVLEQMPVMNPGLFSPYVFSLKKAGERYYTVLQATDDPGAPLVAAGALVLTLGLIVVFFLSHRRLWIRLEPRSKGGSRIGVAGSSNRDPVGLDNEIKNLLAKIRIGEGKV